MPNDLPVPPELQNLIEKRETDDHREGERRSHEDRRVCDLGPLGAVESLEDLDELPATDRRSGQERRQGPERRKAARRKSDSQPPLPEAGQ